MDEVLLTLVIHFELENITKYILKCPTCTSFVQSIVQRERQQQQVHYLLPGDSTKVTF